MNVKKQNQLERLLLSTLLLYRYEEEIHLIEIEIGDVAAKEAGEKNAIKKAFGEITSKFRKQDKEDELAKNLKQAKDNRDAYLKTASAELDVELARDEAALIEAVNEHFDRDNGSKRLAMGLEVCLQEANRQLPELLRPEQSRKKVSAVLFGDEEKLGKMLEVYLYCVARITGKRAKLNGEKTVEKGAKLSAMGAGIAAIGLFTGIGLLLGTAIGLSGLAMMAVGSKRKKDEALATDDLLLFSTFIVSGDTRKNRFGRFAAKRLKKLGREATEKGYVFALASAITIYNFRFEDKTTLSAKEGMSAMLERIDALRSDAEYNALVERIDADENHRKFVCANRSVELLYELVGPDAKKHPQEEDIIIVEPVAA